MQSDDHEFFHIYLENILMNTSSSSAQDRSLGEWYNLIKNGHIKLPNFQRMEAWDSKRICSFWNTVIHNLPVGVALILKVGDEEKFDSRFISTAELEGHVTIGEHLLDGQQRLTALWRGLHKKF